MSSCLVLLFTLSFSVAAFVQTYCHNSGLFIICLYGWPAKVLCCVSLPIFSTVSVLSFLLILFLREGMCVLSQSIQASIVFSSLTGNHSQVVVFPIIYFLMLLTGYSEYYIWDLLFIKQMTRDYTTASSMYNPHILDSCHIIIHN